MSRRFVVLFIIALFALGGCAKTKLVSTWSKPEFKGPALKKILVVAVIRDKMKRRIYEDSLVKKLRDDGVFALASYTKMADLDEDKDVNIARIKAIVKESGFDGVIGTILTSVDSSEQYIPASAVFVSGRGGAYGMYDYFGYSHSMVYQSGYTIENTTVKINVSVFSTKDGEMLWSGDTTSLNPNSPIDVVSDNIELITQALKKEGII